MEHRREIPVTWLDKAIGMVAPNAYLRRVQARLALQVLATHYDGANTSRRTAGWRRPGGDPNAATGVTLSRLRDSARQLVRNNGHAQGAIQTIIDDVVGWGIMSSAKHEAWKAWTTSTDIDADGRCDLAGIEQLVMRTVVESGECLIRRRNRRPSDGLPLPLQLQVLEPDFIDTSKHRAEENGGRTVRGVEYDRTGRRVAYWLFREHPGTTTTLGNLRFGQSVRVPASHVLHVFRVDRPGQVRGASWFAPGLLRFNDFDELADATLVKAKVAACLAVLTTDVDGSGPRIGDEDTDNTDRDLLEPGMIMNVPPGREIEVVQPPSVREYPEFARMNLREIAIGLGVTYEDMTGDYTNLPFSAARMSRLRHWSRVYGWRWRMMVPQFLKPMMAWANDAAQLAGLEPIDQAAFWTAPPLPMIEPDKEGLAIQRNIRTGITTHSEALRERGYVPDEFWDEYAADLDELDRRGIVLDSDARNMTQAGQLHTSAAAAGEGAPPQARLSASKLLAGMGITTDGNGGGQVEGDQP